jgi:SIR2-like protein
MSFASLAPEPVADLIERFAGAEKLTVLVGAGASMEAELPSWRELVTQLLKTVAREQAELDTEERRETWIERIVARDDLLGAAAVVEVMASQPLERLVPRHLYGEAGAAGYRPGPIARQVAELRGCFGDDLEILTTNYDDLLELALVDSGVAASKIRSYTTNRSPGARAAGAVGVTHLHGLAGREGAPKKIVLTEEHYHRMQRGTSWQEELVTERLTASRCLFVGTSLADPNLIRYLYGYGPAKQARHAAIFVRESEPAAPAGVRTALERAAAERWRRCGVEPIFVDHFADAAQLLYEIRFRRESGDGYTPVGERAVALITAAESGLGVDGADEIFAHRQVIFSRSMRQMLTSMVEALAAIGFAVPPSEKLGMALWLLGGDGRKLTGWMHSDRAHQDPSTVAPVAIEAASSWIAVRAVCRGTRVEDDVDTYASRWRFARGLPIVLEGASRVPVGALTLTSTKPKAQSVLGKAPPWARNEMHLKLESMAARLVEMLISAGEGEGGERVA